MSKQIEAMKLALGALEVATTPLAKDRQEVLRAQAALREALAEQPTPVQQVGTIGHIGDGPTTLTAAITPLLAEQPAQQDIPDLIAGALGVSRGTAYDMMREALAEQPAEQEPMSFDRLSRGMEILAWNRAQAKPPIEISKEQWVADELERFYTTPQAPPAGYAKKIESLIAERDALKARLAEQPAQQWTDETVKVPDHVWADCRKTKTISGDCVCDCRIGECPEKENGRIGQECARQGSDGLGDRLPPSPLGVGYASLQQGPQPPYEFERYVAGSLRAQGVRVERATTLADAMRIAAKICPPANPPSAPTVLVYTTPQPPAQPAPRQPLTDEMVTAAARALNKRQAEACGVDKNDHWKFYGDDIKEDARAVLEAAHGITKGNT